MNIVVIDNNLTTRHTIIIALRAIAKSLGTSFKVHTSDNGIEGLGYVYVINPDLIIIDSTLPKYSGSEVYNFILGNVSITDKNVIILVDNNHRKINAPDNCHIIYKNQNNVIEQLYDVIVQVTSQTPIQTNLFKKISLKLTKFFGRLAINTATYNDMLVHRFANKSLAVKIFLYYPVWFANEIIDSFYLTLLYILNGKPKDDNIEQVNLDFAKYRIKYYPTLATIFTSLFICAMQMVLFVIGSVTVLNTRVVGIFAAISSSATLDLNQSVYNEDLIEKYENGIRLKYLLADDQENSPDDSQIPTEDTTPIGSGNMMDSEPADQIVESTESTSEQSGSGASDVLGISDENSNEESTIAEAYTTLHPTITFTQEIEFNELNSILEISNLNDEISSKLDTPEPSENSISYQISFDNLNWMYFDGTIWNVALDDWRFSNPVQVMNKNLNSLPSEFNKIYLKAYLNSDGQTSIELNQIVIERDLDILTPIEEVPVETLPEELPSEEILAIKDKLTPVLLSAAWKDGTKAMTGRINRIDNFEPTDEQLEHLRVKIYYTEDTNFYEAATSKTDLIGMTNIERMNGKLKFKLVLAGEDGGYLTSQIVYLVDPTDEGSLENQIIVSDFSRVVENSLFSVDAISDEPDLTPGDLFCETGLGYCTLRAAIQETNALAGPDYIEINTGDVAPITIIVSSAYPAITGELEIDGIAQSASADCSNLDLYVTIDGSAMMVGNGFLSQSSTVHIFGFVIQNFPENGIQIDSGADFNEVDCNIIGLQVDGTTAAGNDKYGVSLLADSANIGDEYSYTRNLISSNGLGGIYALSDFSRFKNNIVGSDKTGTLDRGNSGAGIYVAGNSNTIGGYNGGITSCTDECNLVSGNNGNGIYVEGDSNNLFGNFVGTSKDGESVIANSIGLNIVSGSSNVIGQDDQNFRNIIAGNSLANIRIITSALANNHQIIGNFVGTNSSGLTRLGTSTSSNIELIPSGAGVISNTLIDSNVIAGQNNAGIKLNYNVESTTITRNNIGVGSDDTTSITGSGFASGIEIDTALDTIIGGLLTDANLIKNQFLGIYVHAIEPNGVDYTLQILNNQISQNTSTGIDYEITGAGRRAIIKDNTLDQNGSYYAIFTNKIQASVPSDFLIESNTITNTQTSGGILLIDSRAYLTGNTITGNAGNGIDIQNFNTIANPHSVILENQIYNNSSIGIDIDSDGVTANDGGMDSDTGANDMQNYPVLDSFQQAGADLKIFGSLHSLASTQFRLDFYSNAAADSSGNGEGETPLGYSIITTNGSGDYDFSVSPITLTSTSMPIGQDVLTATATICLTSPNCDDLGNATSEFSNALGSVSTISGTIFDDSDSSGLIDLGESGIDGVTVRIYNDDGSSVGSPDGTDSLEATTTTASGGNFSFDVASTPATYWVSVQASTISAPALPDQTYGIAGAFCTDGAGSTAELAGDGSCFGGAKPNNADVGTLLTNSEHVTKVQTTGGNVTKVDSGFSFSVVTNTNSTGQGSLSQFIDNANNISGTQTSVFKLAQDDDNFNNNSTPLDSSDDFWNINFPTINLPTISTPMTIDATSQSGYVSAPVINLVRSSANSFSLFTISGSDSTIKGLAMYDSSSNSTLVEISGDNNTIGKNFIGLKNDGSLVSGHLGNGIWITGNSNTIGGISMRNVISGNSVGIQIGGSTNVIVGNYIGSSIDGSSDVNFAQGTGIQIDGDTNQIGGVTHTAGSCDGECNLIVDYDNGILLAGNSNIVEGNFVGTNLTGDSALPNLVNGIKIIGNNNIIGGTNSLSRNLVSGNDENGIEINSTSATDNSIVNNYIGTNASGDGDLGNLMNGILITDAPDNTIGGSNISEANVISCNDENGMEMAGSGATGNIVKYNLVGLLSDQTSQCGNAQNGIEIANSASDNLIATGNVIANNTLDGINISSLTSTGNTISQNEIYSNGELGIDIDDVNSNSFGVNANDSLDSDNGGNNLINFPTITSVREGSTIVKGNLNAEASSNFTIEFFYNTAEDTSGYGEGENYLGLANITTDASGNASINSTFPISIPIGSYLSATATDGSGNTSEFSTDVKMLSASGSSSGGHTTSSTGVTPIPIDSTTPSPTTITSTVSPTQQVTTIPTTITSATNNPGGSSSTVVLVTQTPTQSNPGGLIIGNVTVTTSQENSSVQICWDTNLPSSGYVQYGNEIYEFESAKFTDLATNRCVSIDDIQLDSQYQFEIITYTDSENSKLKGNFKILGKATEELISPIGSVKSQMVERATLVVPMSLVVLIDLILLPNLFFYAFPWLRNLSKPKWGYIYDNDTGRVIPFAKVKLVKVDGKIENGRSGYDGSYRFDQVGLGMNSIEVRHPLYFARRVELNISSTDFAIELDIAIAKRNAEDFFSSIKLALYSIVYRYLLKFNITIFTIMFIYSFVTTVGNPNAFNLTVASIYSAQIVIAVLIDRLMNTKIIDVRGKEFVK